MPEYIDRSKSICNNCIDTECDWRTTGWGIDPPVMGPCPNFRPKIDHKRRSTYVASETKTVMPGEKISLQEKSASQVRVRAGVFFEDDGKYIVTVSGEKIIVEKIV